MPYDKAVGVITIACEASNQPHSARQGVAATLFNRLRLGRYGKTIAAICLKRFQYSEWLGDAVDNANLERVASLPCTDPIIIDCALAYDQVASGADPTAGATHFYADSIPPPPWAVQAMQTIQLGALIFFRDVP